MDPSSLFSSTEPTCPMSESVHPHPLYRRLNKWIHLQDDHKKVRKLSFSMCYTCKGENVDEDNSYYYCSTCKLDFHFGCHLFPPEIKHPFHPSHILTLLPLDPKLDTSHLRSLLFLYFIPHLTGKLPTYQEEKGVCMVNGSYKKCKCCLQALGLNVYYQCSICDFILNAICALKPPSLTISNHKSHEHTLNIFPRRISSPCDACGESLEDIKDVVYACLPCNYMVHSKCVYLPRLIKITRHQHRISHGFSLSPGDFTCGVCRKNVDINYGQYSCKKRCHYAVHSKCATRYDVWDGKDLEGVPEEPEEDVEPFVRIDEETIQHFSHQQHYLKFHKNINTNTNTNTYGEAKYCEACCLPIPNSTDFYGCLQCDFLLDEACASLPRKKHHPIHKHPLVLHPIPLKPFDFMSLLLFQGTFRCDGCYIQSCGFVYKCLEKDCKFQLDVGCASLPDPLIHGCHPQDHPLFFNLTRGECIGCKTTSCSWYYLECMQCKSFLGVKCATLPSLAYYKHDRHPLALHYGEKGRTNDEYWCEICESTLDAETWFYTCDLCRVTLHVNCLLGGRMYTKPHRILKVEGEEDIEIGSNNGNSRPLCSLCGKRCKEVLLFFKGGDEYLCSWDCLLSNLVSKKL